MGPNLIPAPRSWIETVSELRLPSHEDDRLQFLMGRNNEGVITSEERRDLESLVGWSESMALIRAQALLLLERRPMSRA